MTRNKNETPEQREKRLEKQKLYYLKRKAAGMVNQSQAVEKVLKQQNKVLRRRVTDINTIELEHEIFDKTQLKIPIPPSVRSKLLEKRQQQKSEPNGALENDTGRIKSDKRIIINNNDDDDEDEDDDYDEEMLDEDEDEDEDPSSVKCDVCRKRFVNEQYTLFRMNELSETLKILLPDDLHDDVLLKLCPRCKIKINKSCLF